MSVVLDPTPAPSAAAPAPSSDHRRRLLEAMAETVARKGFADTTIADLAARVSRRTFYEHFDSKAECLIALYRASSRQALSVLVEAIDPSRDWHEQLEAALYAYFSKLASNPVLLSTLFIEVLNLRAEGLRARRAVNEELANFMLQVVNTGAGSPSERPLTSAMAMGVVGAVNELVLQAIEQDQHDRLPELTPLVAQLLRAVAAAA
jgi:AcrR family transcriptional regulator